MLRVKLVYDNIKAKWKENFMIMDAALCEVESEAYIYTFSPAEHRKDDGTRIYGHNMDTLCGKSQLFSFSTSTT